MREPGQAPGLWSVVRRARFVAAGVIVCVALIAGAGAVHAQSARADVSATLEGGHGRVIFTFDGDVKAGAQVSNNILIVSFSRPVELSTEGLQKRLAGYVQAVRRDPDGTALRMSLSRRVTVNTMAAGEKLFVDLLPESWTGLPPGLPQSVVDDLAKRARNAERNAQVRRPTIVEMPELAIVRLQVSSAPTFSRLAFELPAPIEVGVQREGQEVRIAFAAPVKVDLGAARMQLPKGVVGLDVAFEEKSSTVKLVLAPNANARDFREDRSVMLDVSMGPLGGSAPSVIHDLAQDADKQKEIDAEAEAAAMRAAAQQAAPQETPPAVAERIGDGMAPVPVDLSAAPDAEPAKGLIPVVGRHGGHFSVDFPFTEPVSAAAFVREGNIWLLFDTPLEIDVSAIIDDPTRSVHEARYVRSNMGAAVRLRPTLTRLPSFERVGNSWRLILADNVVAPSQPLPLRRVANPRSQGAMLVPLSAPSFVHHLQDPDIGDTVVVVTAQPPERGVLREQVFVDFRALASLQGVAIVPIADDLSVTLATDGVTVGRPEGLSMSNLPAPPPPIRLAAERRPSILDPESWKAEQELDFAAREGDLVDAVALSPAGQRADARLVLARFYLARGFAAEAIGVLEAGVREDNQIQARPQYFLFRGVAELEMGRPHDALRLFRNAKLDGVAEASVLQTIANADLGRWTPARDALRTGARALDDLPVALQRRVLFGAVRSSIEVRDLNDASRYMQDLELMQVPPAHQANFVLLSARLSEGVGRFDRAKVLYETVAESEEGPAAAEALLRSLSMRFARGELSRVKTIERLEGLALVWRRDRIELDTIRLLGRLYVQEARYQDAFRLLDAALMIDPEADTTHEFHNEMAAVFEDLFLTGKADSLPSIEALALYYDFSRLTPIGRRGDELIRRLSERLVAVDLLDQAAELLDHQVNYRLTGAAKAQVAAKLAVVHLMNRKPAEAVRVLSASRLPQMPAELREQRLFIEARALSETGRHDTALELMENLRGPEADRLRADIQWAAKNWREAGERLEAIVGERWKGEEGLEPSDRHDVLRAALAYTLGREQLGLARIKDKFSPKMGETTEGKVLGLLVSSEGATPRTLAEAARALASYDSLGTFIARYRKRYPDQPLEADPVPTSSLFRAQRVTGR